MEELPFTPYSATLQDILRKKYIKPVAEWLLSSDDQSVLAQKAGSAWESALTIISLAEASHIFEACNEEVELRKRIRDKSALVALWLLQKKCHDNKSGRTYLCWERVTWDTAVVIRALLVALARYKGSFSDEQTDEILAAVTSATRWLHHRFIEWETDVKYPFGPADIAQIASTMIYLERKYPHIHEKVTREFYDASDETNLATEIVKYLIHIKTEKSIAVPITAAEHQDIVTCWWDDYFTTAEVIESLARFQVHVEGDSSLKERHKMLLSSIRLAVTEACGYFEQNQVDGTWGSHIDTIKVLHAYAMIKRMVPRRAKPNPQDSWLLVPEIHTTFKALRWMCDSKQVFSDGSFLHTMFLTIFYSLTICEVYNCWEPAKSPVEKLYDDVVWASPMRTTPERSKRLKLSLENLELLEDTEDLRHDVERARKILLTIISVAIFTPLFFAFAWLTKALKVSLDLSMPDNRGDFFTYAGVFAGFVTLMITLIWSEKIQEQMRKTFQKRKRRSRLPAKEKNP
jgi:hypothetical protein